MKDLHVNDKFTTMIADDQDSYATTATLKGFAEAGPEVGLIDDGESLLHITRFSHCNDYVNVSVETEVSKTSTYRNHEKDQGHGIA